MNKPKYLEPLIIAGLFATWSLFLSTFVRHLLVDEWIVLNVIDHLRSNNTLDTNWANVEFVAKRYPSNQYNFSSSILLYGLLSGEIFGKDTVDGVSARFIPVAFSTSSLVFFWLSFKAISNRIVATYATVLTALSYQFLSESFSIRPEATIYLFYSITLYLATSNILNIPVRILLIGFFSGILIASKFSLVLILVQAVVLFTLVTEGFFDRRPLIVARSISSIGAITAIGAFLGVLVGAPHAIVDPVATLDGISALLTQYSKSHWPYGRPDENVSIRFAYAANQTQSHIGLIALLLAACAMPLALRQRHVAIGFLAFSSMGILVYFGTKPVYFARNFSTFTPVLCFLAFWTIHMVVRTFKISHLRILLLPVFIQPAISFFFFSASVLTFDSRKIEFQSKLRKYEQGFELETFNIDGWEGYRNPKKYYLRAMQDSPSLYNVRSMGDPFTEIWVDAMEEADLAVRLDTGAARLRKFPQSMIHRNFDVPNHILLIDVEGSYRNQAAYPGSF